MQVLITASISLKYRRLKKNRDFAVMCAMGFAFISLGFVVIGNAINYYVICVGTMTLGIGMGLMMPNSTLWVISITKPHKRPFFVGLFTATTFFGKFLSPVFASPFVSNYGIKKTFIIDAFIMLFIAILAMYFNDYFKRVNRVLFRKELQNLKKQMFETYEEN